ncbi:MAG: nicotinate-nucleotide adenylyltransferase [Pseudomonadales bacterium]|nr:nicotinate-nucleotide adenylyltransferase [Pseudomonadales bacterium]
MRQAGAARRIGVFGGTFDPVHNGHLRTALELVGALQLDELRLIPCHTPALRTRPAATATQRLAMLRLALADCAPLQCDDREIRRGSTSYTIDTLRSLRAELGASARLCLIVGADAFAAFDSWKEWDRMVELAHIVVMERPGERPAQSPVLARWVAARAADDIERALGQAPCGGILSLQLTQLAISASHIRALLSAGYSPRFLLPDAVLDYIRRHHLYESATPGEQGASV